MRLTFSPCFSPPSFVFSSISSLAFSFPTFPLSHPLLFPFSSHVFIDFLPLFSCLFNRPLFAFLQTHFLRALELDSNERSDRLQQVICFLMLLTWGQLAMFPRWRDGKIRRQRGGRRRAYHASSSFLGFCSFFSVCMSFSKLSSWSFFFFVPRH